MNILLVCTKYNLDPDSPWLSNDLVNEFASKGYQVTVIYLDWNGDYKNSRVLEFKNIKVILFSMGKIKKGFIGLAYKWFFMSLFAIPFIRKHINKNEFDLFISFSPSIVSLWIRPLLLGVKIKRSYLIYWDFFPKYHIELGLIPKKLYGILRHLEQFSIRYYDRIGVMSNRNVEFFKQEFKNVPGTIEVISLWGSNLKDDYYEEEVSNTSLKVERNKLGFVENDILCMWGGQLIPGRGIELLLDLASRVINSNPNIKFLVAGDGPLKDYLISNIKDKALSNIKYVGLLSRDTYIEYLRLVDIGLVFNSGHVSVPTFPSKSVDYFRMSLPILGAVEAATDFSEIINNIGAGYSCVAQDIDKIESNLYLLSDSKELRNRCGINGYYYYKNNMQVSEIVKQLVE